jgi:hypothetical protein
MKRPPRDVLEEYGLPLMERAYAKVEETRARPDRESVVAEFLKEPPDNFPDRYDDTYIRAVYWREVALLIWHLFTERRGFLTDKIPQWRQLDLFKALPALRRCYAVPEGGTGRIRDRDTEKMNAAEAKAALRQIIREAMQLRRLYRRLQKEEAEKQPAKV